MTETSSILLKLMISPIRCTLAIIIIRFIIMIIALCSAVVMYMWYPFEHAHWTVMTIAICWAISNILLYILTKVIVKFIDQIEDSVIKTEQKS